MQNQIANVPISAVSTPASLNKRTKTKAPVEFFLKVVDGVKTVASRYVEEKEENWLNKLTGIQDNKLVLNIIAQGVASLPNTMNEADRYNLIVQSLADASPTDAYEARLCVQSTVFYVHGMDYLERAREVFSSDTFAKDHWHTIYMKSATRLLDQHTKTVEAISRYRQKGEQRIVVQHVTVENGGKAVVGNILPGGGG